MKTIDPTVSTSNKRNNRIDLDYAEELMQIVLYWLISSSSATTKSNLLQSTLKVSFNVPFEEDIFRIVLLESIGGYNKDIIDDLNCISQRHNAEILNLVYNPKKISNSNIP
jgi:hypothetical protein